MLFSCQEKEKQFQDEKNVFFVDSLYTRFWFDIDLHNGVRQEAEVYISKQNDTILNQFKQFKFNVLDTLVSHYYDLEIKKTDIPNVYRGKITLHSKFENLKPNNKNIRVLEFNYLEQSKDSIWRSNIKSKKNTIEFKFQNFYEKKLSGMIYEYVKIEREKTFKVNQMRLLIDTHKISDNIFLSSAGFNKNNLSKELKLKLVSKK